MFYIYVTIAFCLYLIGLVGVFITRKNIIIMLMSIELMLLAINFIFLILSSVLGDVQGQLMSLFILTIAAAESSIGLAILIMFYRVRGNVSMDYITNIKS